MGDFACLLTVSGRHDKDSAESARKCFAATDWWVFFDSCADLNELADIITSCIIQFLKTVSFHQKRNKTKNKQANKMHLKEKKHAIALSDYVE